MSQVSEVVSTATQVDWKLVAAAAATFMATVVITILGWWNGRRKIEKRMEGSIEGHVTGAILLDNQTIREATTVNREVRDRLLVHCEALNANTKSLESHTGSMDDILEELKAIRKILDRS